MINISCILNPKETIDKLFYNYLYPIYINDYGIENASEISKRYKKIILLPYSTPFDTLKFVNNNRSEINDNEFVDRVMKEYKDFMSVRKKICSETKRQLKRYLESLAKQSVDNAVFIFSYNDSILESFDDDLSFSMYYGSSYEKPLVHEINAEFEKLRNIQNKRLIEETKWGKRILAETNNLIPSELLGWFLLGPNKNSPLTAYLKNDSGESLILIHIPFMSLKENIDRIVLGELRHAIETTKDKIGISTYEFPHVTINEIRNEYNALLDDMKLEKAGAKKFESFTGKNPNNFYHISYGFFFPHCKYLIRNRQRLNKMAFSESTKAIEYSDIDFDELEFQANKVLVK